MTSRDARCDEAGLGASPGVRVLLGLLVDFSKIVGDAIGIARSIDSYAGSIPLAYAIDLELNRGMSRSTGATGRRSHL